MVEIARSGCTGWLPHPVKSHTVRATSYPENFVHDETNAWNPDYLSCRCDGGCGCSCDDRLGVRRGPVRQGPGTRLLPHDAGRLRDHRLVRRHGAAADGEAAHQHHAGQARRGVRQGGPQAAVRHLGQRLPDQYRRQAGAGRYRRGRAVRPDAGQPGRQPEGVRLPARAGRRDLHHPPARRSHR